MVLEVLDAKKTFALEIRTFGKFRVSYKGNILSEEAGRSYRMWDLFKYLITFRDRGILPETAAEILWPERQYSEPKSAFRTSIYRLRQILSGKTNSKNREEYITFSQGCYLWNTSTDYWLDAQEFEAACHRGQLLTETAPEAAVESLKYAISLYKGEYLPECMYHEWVIPIRNYYHRLFLENALSLCGLLKKTGDTAGLFKVCEKVFLIEPLEEDFHLYYLDACLACGKAKEAYAHYNDVTERMYRELGAKPSAAMRSLHKRIRAEMEAGNASADLCLFQAGPGGKEESGAFFCDSQVFLSLYEVEKRRAERTGGPLYLGKIALFAGQGSWQQSLLKKGMHILGDIFLSNLRKGDVVTLWQDNQYLVLMPALARAQGDEVLRRIKNIFQEKCPGMISIESHYRPDRPLAQASSWHWGDILN
ncbi:MAG TPA: hypothetical protein GX697_02720 [Firmicutes bacterium]|nr:hypothetical protein [Bacillota bacterium]